MRMIMSSGMQRDVHDIRDPDWSESWRIMQGAGCCTPLYPQHHTCVTGPSWKPGTSWATSARQAAGTCSWKVFSDLPAGCLTLLRDTCRSHSSWDSLSSQTTTELEVWISLMDLLDDRFGCCKLNRLEEEMCLQMTHQPLPCTESLQQYSH